MPETCGCDCYTITDYNGEEIVQCPLHAHAAEMRELLKDAMRSCKDRAEKIAVSGQKQQETPAWYRKARALLEATHA